MIGRRRFLKLIGVTSAAAPMAARAAAEQEALNLTHIGHTKVLASNMAANDGPGISFGPQPAYDRASNYVKLFGMPEHVERSLRQRANYVSWLDHDIASKRSWSLAYKVYVQRERNFASFMESYKDLGWYERAQTAFEKIAGFKWPW